MVETLLSRLLTAFAIGLLVGIERGWRERDAPAGSRTAGVRTYTITALIGALSAIQTQALASPWPLCVAMLAFVAVFAWFKMREVEHDNEFSVTGVLAAFTVFLLGAFAVLGDPHAAAAGGIATAGVLAAREPLHGWLARLTWKELRSALLLLAMTVIVLPALPNRMIDPWMSINPREIWIFTILTASVSYGGYIAVRVAGPSLGVIVGSLMGSIVSSTAVTIALARRSASNTPRLFAGGALVGGMVSILRVLIIVSLVDAQLAGTVLTPALAAAAVFCVGGFAAIYSEHQSEDGSIDIGNPFDIGPLLVFAFAYIVIAIANSWLAHRIGSGAMLFTSGISALFDVDIAVLAASRLASEAANVATQAVLVALGSNALSRSVVATVAGPAAFYSVYLLGTSAALLAGFITWFMTN